MEGVVYHNYLLLLELLKMGIPFDTIQGLEERDVVILLGINRAIEERRLSNA